MAIAKGEDAPEELCERLAALGYLAHAEDSYELTFPVFDRESKDISGFTAEEQRILTESAKEVRRLIEEAKAYTNKVTREDLPLLFKNDDRLSYFACTENYIDRGFILDQALADGWLKYDENTSPVVGAYLYVD